MEWVTETRALPWVILHVAVGVWGLLDLLLGFAIFRALLGVFGGFIGAVAGAWLGAGWVEGWAGPVVGGGLGLIAGSFLAWYVTVAGLALLGAGAALALTAPVFTGRWGTPWDDVALAGAMVLGGALAAVMLRPVIIVATSATGAFRAVYAAAFLWGIGPNLFLLRDGLEGEGAPGPAGLAAALARPGWLPWVVLGVTVLGVMAQSMRASPGKKGD